MVDRGLHPMSAPGRSLEHYVVEFRVLLQARPPLRRRLLLAALLLAPRLSSKRPRLPSAGAAHAARQVPRAREGAAELRRTFLLWMMGLASSWAPSLVWQARAELWSQFQMGVISQGSMQRITALIDSHFDLLEQDRHESDNVLPYAPLEHYHYHSKATAKLLRTLDAWTQRGWVARFPLLLWPIKELASVVFLSHHARAYDVTAGTPSERRTLPRAQPVARGARRLRAPLQATTRSSRRSSATCPTSAPIPR